MSTKNTISFGETPFEESDEPGDLAATITELRMQQLSYTLRSKPSWWVKYKDPAIQGRWEAEGVAIDFEGQHLTKEEVQYVLDELEGYSKMRDEETGIQQSCYARVYESDSLITDDLRGRLITAASKLEAVPDAEKDWHPRSNEQVLDLIHPSLYCLVYGRTAGFPSGEVSKRKPGDFQIIKNAVLPMRGAPEDWAVSKRFSWIPTEFDISADGQSAKAVSYINNLHPSHTGLYAVVEALVSRFSNLFDRVLTDLVPGNGGFHRRISGSYGVTDDTADEPEYLPPGGNMHDQAYDDEFDQLHEAWRNSRVIDPPSVPQGGYASTQDISLRTQQYSLRGRRAQIIVKFANIHLTPDKPVYPGGSWHVEGMANENIVASGIYYYDVENIMESHLAFRSAVNGVELPYEQDDELGTKATWGLDRSTPSNQVVGSVSTKVKRCIAFPNVYQHKVSSFSLADKTKPGYRKIVALFLIHPNTPIPSTMEIPPQQAHWAREAMATAHEDSPFGKLPLELLIKLSEDTDTLMTEEEARKYRLELMDERTAFVSVSDENHFEVPFSMCEH